VLEKKSGLLFGLGSATRAGSQTLLKVACGDRKAKK